MFSKYFIKYVQQVLPHSVPSSVNKPELSTKDFHKASIWQDGLTLNDKATSKLIFRLFNLTTEMTVSEQTDTSQLNSDAGKSPKFSVVWFHNYCHKIFNEM
jgi:hypothetical protein